MVMRLLGLALACLTLLAHEEFQVIGTVTKISASELEVKMKNGKLVSMGMLPQTAVLDNERKSSLAQIKKGQSVVVTAFGDSYEDLGVLEVRIVLTDPKGPTRITPKSAKQR